MPATDTQPGTQLELIPRHLGIQQELFPEPAGQLPSCATCTGPLPQRPINGPYFVRTDEGPHGGHYERRDFCSGPCSAAAPQYHAPKRPRQPRQQGMYGDLALVGLALGHQPRKATR